MIRLSIFILYFGMINCLLPAKLVKFYDIGKKEYNFDKERGILRLSIVAIKDFGYFCVAFGLRIMIATKEYIERKFEEYNGVYFGGTLPPIPVRLSNAKGFLGKVSYRKVRQGLFGKTRNTDFVLRINTRIDLPEEVIEDTILHEMIHYYIGYRQLQDTSSHGELFRQMMGHINHAGNRHITVSHRLTEEQQRQAAGKEKVRVAGVVHFKDGRTGIKIVPKQVRSILHFHNGALRHFPIDRIEWYLTKDGYFGKYPSSNALRIYLVTDAQELQNALSDARPVLCDGRTVRLSNSNSSQSW